MIKNLSIYFCLISVQYITAKCERSGQGIFSIQVSSNDRVELIDSKGNYLSKAVVCDFDWGWTTIDNASWIWNSNYAKSDETVYFRVNIPIYGTPISGTLTVAVDDLITVYFKGNDIQCSDSGYYYTQICNVLPYLEEGDNIFTFTAYNGNGSGGLVFKFDIEARF